VDLVVDVQEPIAMVIFDFDKELRLTVSPSNSWAFFKFPSSFIAAGFIRPIFYAAVEAADLLFPWGCIGNGFCGDIRSPVIVFSGPL
jgi:hypothetical protein